MTLANEEKQALIFYRLKQADESAEAAQLLMANNKTAAAINRIYYTIFYCVLALALKFGLKHQNTCSSLAGLTKLL